MKGLRLQRQKKVLLEQVFSRQPGDGKYIKIGKIPNIAAASVGYFIFGQELVYSAAKRAAVFRFSE